MVLTNKGWTYINDVNENDCVLTLNTNTNEIEIQRVTRKIKRKHNDLMLHIKGDFIDDIVTPMHGYPLYKNGVFSVFIQHKIYIMEIYKK